MGRLPHFLSYGAPPKGGAKWSSAIMSSKYNFTSSYRRHRKLVDVDAGVEANEASSTNRNKKSLNSF